RRNAYTDADISPIEELADRCAGAMERIGADEARLKSEAQFRIVWDSSGDGMRLTNAQGIVQAVNAAYCTMVEKPETELVGFPLSVIQPEEKRASALRKHCERMAANHIPSRREDEVTLWNEKRIWLEITSSLLEVAGEAPLLL